MELLHLICCVIANEKCKRKRDLYRADLIQVGVEMVENLHGRSRQGRSGSRKGKKVKK
jgi:hypothetical protein